MARASFPALWAWTFRLHYMILYWYTTSTLALKMLVFSIASSSRAISSSSLRISKSAIRRRWQSSTPPPTTKEVENGVSSKKSFWTNAETWGFMSAMAGWTMSIAAISDAVSKGPEVISLPMTSVLVLYSSLFLRWSFAVKPQNLFLGACHFTNICAQLNQGRRAIEYKLENNLRNEVDDTAQKVGVVVAVMGGAILGGPVVQAALIRQNLGRVSAIAAADAGPFTIHFWAPMSKWLLSGASLLDYKRPTDKISISQYSSLTLCGLIHSWYALLVTPVNYMLCSVNVALLLSSGWHLGRKIHADYFKNEKIEDTNAD